MGHYTELEEAAYSYMSVVYCKLILSISISHVISEILTVHIPVFYFEGFFTYLYSAAIAFFLYLFCYIIPYNKKEEPSESERSSSTSIELQSRYQSKATLTAKAAINDHSHIGFAERIGAVVFGIGTIIFSSMNFAVVLERGVHFTKYQIHNGVNFLLQCIFTIMQIYFICAHKKLNILRHPTFARFGLMHLVATNLCVWFGTTIRESIHDVQEYSDIGSEKESKLRSYNTWQDGSLVYVTPDSHLEDQPWNMAFRRKSTYIGNLTSKASPYLFPLTIEFSLISATVLYSMWKHIGVESHHKEEKEEYAKLDSRGSGKGFLLGSVTVMLVLVILGVFHSYGRDEDEGFTRVAIYLVDSVHVFILISSIVATCIGISQARKLRITEEEEDALFAMLLRMSAFGWYLYALFTLIAGTLSSSSASQTALVSAVGIINIIQITLQLFFIADISARAIYLPEHVRTRPGRQVVTYLLMSNFSLWFMYTFEIAEAEANPVHINFFGAIQWAVLLRILLPLGIFFRFHSLVAFSEIWKECFRVKARGY